MYTPSESKDIVAFLYKEQNGRFAPAGTGFQIVVVEANLVFNYLVTCKHVVEPILDDRAPIHARFNRSDKLDVEFRALPGGWVFHRDEAVDLAVLPMDPTGEPFSLAALPVDALLTDERLRSLDRAPAEGDEVFFIGLFEPYTGYSRNIPVVRFGRIAMVTDELIPGRYGPAQYYLLECQAFPFNSGSPLFAPLVENGHPARAMMGVISGFFPEKQQMWTDDKGFVVFTHFGISTAVPAMRIHDLLYDEALVDLRRKGIGAGHIIRGPLLTE